MLPGTLHDRLSQISTSWSMLRQAHDAATAGAAQQLIMLRYGGAVYRYLLAALHDSAAAEDLTQEFALSLVRGQFRRADPRFGRFRDYVKTVLFHLVSKHRHRQQRLPQLLPPGHPEWSALVTGLDDDFRFRETWQEALLARTWQALHQCQPTFYEVLQFRTEHPDMPSKEMARQLGRRLERPLTPAGLRQTLHRARQKFAELLLEAVAHSLDHPSQEMLKEELMELNLLSYCRAHLQTRERSLLGRP